MFGKCLTATAAAALVVTPFAAVATPARSAASLTLATARASAPMGKTRKTGAGGIAAAALGFLIAGGTVIAVVDRDGDHDFHSN